jgi:hypothetical protein
MGIYRKPWWGLAATLTATKAGAVNFFARGLAVNFFSSGLAANVFALDLPARRLCR